MLKENKLESLESLLPKGQVFTDPATLITYEIDAGLDRGTPEGLVFPQSAIDVIQLARWAAEHHIPLIARGAGTGLSGGAVADHGGIIVEFSRMNHILDLDQNGRSAVLEPAVVNLAFDEQVKAKGLYFPPDPASQRASTIGGNVSENSGGPHCFKYGVTSNYVTGLDIVLADGRSVRIGGRALDYPAYDLCGLLTGSEGTLALLTAIHVRLVRNPPAVKTMMAAFDSLEQAGAAVSAVIAAGLVPATMEMMDRNIIGIVEEYAHAGLPTDAEAVLIIEVDGYPASLDSQMNEVAHLLQTHGGHDLRIAANTQERDTIWYARKSAAGALSRLAPSYYLVDITVPRSLLAETLAEVNSICDRYGLRAGHVFHAGDGNLHPLILIMDPQDQQLVETVHRAGREMIELCIRKDGSITGEHGVGIEKRQYMPLMFNDAELTAMWDIKQIFDPNGLLNPGKIFSAGANNGVLLFNPVINEVEHGQSANEDTSPTQIVFTPLTTYEAAKGLKALSAAGRSLRITGSRFIVPHGSGSRETSYGPDLSRPQGSIEEQAEEDATDGRETSYGSDLSRPRGWSRGETSHAPDILLSTTALNGIKTYAPDDLYITAGAGTPLSEIQSFLADKRMQVPLAAPWPEASIGGLVAANINAPLRMRYGSMRDLVLCATVVLADGRIIRAGRPVIKNVAGYDLLKVFVGSHGTLGLITDVTLKLTPLPRTRCTLLTPIDDLKSGLTLTAQILPLTLVASALLLCKDCDIPAIADMPRSPYMLVYSAEGLPEDVQTELDQVRQLLRAAGAAESIEVETPSGTDIWISLLGNTSREALQVRIGVAARDLAAYVQAQASALNAGAFLTDAGSGQIYVVTPLDNVQAAQNWLETLRQPALASDGYAVVIDMPQTWQGMLDQWDYQPQALDLMRSLKARWDPANILNPGTFIHM